ncbi:hypothetical protein MAC_01375 [Metarhizium acridum CQMa 102]|uniref:RING finger domain-containing protein n=1 Tax=Metarhizium acridum (strain CQMa 102) TaxID=655827 RepID=E9DUS7_METAQ|nr:uncharacterized protein MAC_01375 [Metarhizium acridum CQMa 102]EFY92739.1 hypothetical protein MAC_01375 [Metarhizium acridum CQMa 102]
MDDVEELVIKPFRDVVEKGKLAVENAADSPDMLMEAQRLVKEGERGLRHIERSCKKLYNDYSSNFVAALKENDEITNIRCQLTNLLWDFEDFLEPDTFEASRFKELQKLDRDVAPKVYNILITLKLEPPNFHLSQPSPPLSPRPPSFSHIQPAPQHPSDLGFHRGSGSVCGSQGDARSMTEFSNVEDATAQFRTLLENRQPPSVHGHVRDPGLGVLRLEIPPEQQMPDPPRPPSPDPWDPQRAPYSDHGVMGNYSPVDRRPTSIRAESPIDPAISPLGPDSRRRISSTDSQQSSGSTTVRQEPDTRVQDESRHSGSSTWSSSTNATSHGTRLRHHTFSSTIPEEEQTPRKSSNPIHVPQLQVRPPVPPIPLEHRKPLEHSATRGVDDMRRQYLNRQPQGQPPNVTLPAPPSRQNSTQGIARALSLRSPTPKSQAELEVAPGITDRDYSDLIPVGTEPNTDSCTESVKVSLSQKDCTIGPSSTFYLYKGFCDGAQEVLQGGIGVKKTKRPGFSGTTTVARCTGCLFELDFSQIEIDVNKEDKGNFYKSGINYRLRFLQKSHLAAKRVDDVLYACVFCVASRRTIDECDSTVFTNTKALFTHLSHHPRPLPEVPGIAVVEGPEMPAHLRNDFDVWFRNPPEAHPAQLNLSEIAGKATGITKDHSRRLYGQRLLFDRSPALELCHGAKITGITWPEKHNGEWIFAWHDGIHASTPADIVKLDAPPSEEIRMVGSSLVRAKSRWKFVQKDKEKDKSLWLRFDKNEAITNISYASPDHWCWSGTNAKGKWGIFPKVFLEPSTIQELTTEGADRALTLNKEKNKSLSMLSRFPKRRPSGRPPSIAGSTGSTSSRETQGGRISLRNSRGSSRGTEDAMSSLVTCASVE